MADARMGERNAADARSFVREFEDVALLLLPALAAERHEVVLMPEAGRLTEAGANDMLAPNCGLSRLLPVMSRVCGRDELLP